MIKTKKRLSAGLGLNADGVDPLFEFDVPRLFVDLTQPPRYVKAPAGGGGGGDASPHAVLAHDAWFDLVHENHSRPTEEFLAAHEAERAQSEAQAASGHRVFHHSSAAVDVDEKENSLTGGTGPARMKRRNVAYAPPTDAAPVGTIKATIRTVSAVGGGGAIKKPAKLPFGNSTKSTTGATVVTPASKHTVPHSNAGGASTLPRKRTGVERATETSKARSRTLPAAAAAQRSASGDKDLQDLQALLAKHNKKFKSSHTYEPRQHSVRDVRLWEKHSQKSYYKLSLEDRITANAEIAQFVRERDEAES